MDPPMPCHLTVGQTCHGERETWIVSDRLLVPLRCPVEYLRPARALRFSFFEFSSQEQVISFRIFGGCSGDGVSLVRGKLCLQGIGDFLRDFAFDDKDIPYIAIVTFRPKI